MNELSEKCMGIRGVEVKDPARGEVEAIVARVGVTDQDGDVFLAGAFGSRPVRVSAYNHRSWPQRGGLPPVGRGTIREQGDEVVASLRFFMSTTEGREHFELVKEMGDLQEWSFGWLPGTEETTRVPDGTKAKRAIRSVPVEEVSPVLLAASVGTRTVAARCAGCSTAEAEPTEEGAAGKARPEPRLRNVLPPSSEASKLAAFAVDLSARIHGQPDEPVAFQFFEADGIHNGIAPQYPSVKGRVVRLASNLRGRELARVTLHESRHLYQDEDATREERERDAERFAARWTEPLLHAFEVTGGSTRALHVVSGREPPFYRGGGRRWSSGDLVLSSAGRVWRYTPRNHNAWSAE